MNIDEFKEGNIVFYKITGKFGKVVLVLPSQLGYCDDLLQIVTENGITYYATCKNCIILNPDTPQNRLALILKKDIV